MNLKRLREIAKPRSEEAIKKAEERLNKRNKNLETSYN